MLRAHIVEGTVLSLLEDDNGNIVGVDYKEKKTGNVKVMLPCIELFNFTDPCLPQRQ